MSMESAPPSRVWHRNPWAGVVLRLAGAVLILLAWLAGCMLQARADHHLAIHAVDGGLALVAFVAASIGSAGLVMGGHLFDQVPVADRWRSSRQKRG